MRDLLSKILIRDGYMVLSATDGEQALELLGRETIDIVISDVKMPKVSGFDLLKAVTAEYTHIPVIMMTAYGDTYTVKDALLLGADEYITKPFKAFEISMVVERTYWRVLASRKARQDSIGQGA